MRPLQFLAVMVLGPQDSKLITSITQLIAQYKCSISASRMNVFASEFAISLLVAGQWDGIAKIEAALPKIQSKYKAQWLLKRIETPKESSDVLPYLAQLIGHSKPGIVHEMIHFFSSHHLPIFDLQANTFKAQHTGTLLFSLNIHIGIPVKTSIAEVREQLMIVCDELNIDGILEPERR